MILLYSDLRKRLTLILIVILLAKISVDANRSKYSTARKEEGIY